MPADEAWIVLGPEEKRKIEYWSTGRTQGYNEGFLDAVNAVASGVVGVRGKRCQSKLSQSRMINFLTC